MPWIKTEPMEQKIAFISRTENLQRGQFSCLCQEFHISRKTGYKWLGRYQAANNLTALAEHSRRPHQSPGRISSWLEERILQLRQPDGWGARKIAQLLWEEGIQVSVATVHRTLLRRGQVHPLDQHQPAPGRFTRPRPNDLFQADFKGPMGRTGARDEPLTLLDDHSRFALGVFALPDHKLERVQDCFVSVFEQYGLPRQLLLDHGMPWWNGHNGWGISRLSVFFIQQNIDLIFGQVRHPQTQGKIERFHRTLARSMVHQGLPERWEQWQERYDAFVQRYNHVRPHEALAMQRPAQHYRSSTRPYQKQIARWIYPVGLEICRVDGAGTVRLEGHRYFVSEALVHQEVALERVADQVLVRFRNMYIRELNLPQRSTLPFVFPVRQISGEVLPMS